MDWESAVSTIILRFRDLNIPEGDTIRRHKQSIKEHGHVWWGWIKRQKERFPSELFSTIATTCREKGDIQLYLFDSGAEHLLNARLSGISAVPGGLQLPTPDIRSTPAYMTEALLAAWFKLIEISDSPVGTSSVRIEQFPTLIAPTN